MNVIALSPRQTKPLTKAKIPEAIRYPVASSVSAHVLIVRPPVVKKRNALGRTIISICTQGTKLYYS
jgi:hypothetical protein